MSDVLPLGDPPEIKNDYVFHILEYSQEPKRFGVCVQNKYDNALQSLKVHVKKLWACCSV